jgi:hypothetical protein
MDEVDRRIQEAVRKRELEIAQRLRDVGDVYGAGGHKHRCRMLHALADEIDGPKFDEREDEEQFRSVTLARGRDL